ncbi:MAG: acetyl-CoA carboxylase biotin carboxyl carrier protein [Planctomycetes bacterium]|nr:acetyl-CoA carboxylase biotin carboxyl carrier protein [Planctomycetota bacterium]
MDIEKMERVVLRFIDLMKANDLAEIELQDEGTKIRLKRGTEVAVSAAPPLVSKPAPAEGPAASPRTETKGKSRVEVPSPLVGTFYRSPSPDAQPFVEVGDTVEVDGVLCIVEAMKVMNEIKSEVEGKIVEILVENGQPVEYGQVLFLIEPSGS